MIQWTPLAKSQWNAPGLKYLVRYRRMGEEAEESEWHEFFVEDPFAVSKVRMDSNRCRTPQNMTIVREQPTFRRYLVQVRAVNSRGFSTIEPETHLGWSGEDGWCRKYNPNSDKSEFFSPKVPTKAPGGLRLAAHRNYSSVELEWDPVEEGSVGFGVGIGYQLAVSIISAPSGDTSAAIGSGSGASKSKS